MVFPLSGKIYIYICPEIRYPSFQVKERCLSKWTEWMNKSCLDIGFKVYPKWRGQGQEDPNELPKMNLRCAKPCPPLLEMF